MDLDIEDLESEATIETALYQLTTSKAIARKRRFEVKGRGVILEEARAFRATKRREF